MEEPITVRCDPSLSTPITWTTDIVIGRCMSSGTCSVRAPIGPLRIGTLPPIRIQCADLHLRTFPLSVALIIKVTPGGAAICHSSPDSLAEDVWSVIGTIVAPPADMVPLDRLRMSCAGLRNVRNRNPTISNRMIT